MEGERRDSRQREKGVIYILPYIYVCITDRKIDRKKKYV